MTKKVIFVGGTSYSGSTFLHLAIANDPKGFAVGEVNHLFRPMKKRHASSNWVCGCGDPECDLWSRVKKNGEERLYETIFEIHPEVDFIVDSSKKIAWIDEQASRLARQEFETRHVVIWKTLLEYTHSLWKRNLLQKKRGGTNWPRYHRAYYSMIKNFRAVKYTDFTHEQAEVLKAVCDYLDISYYQGKERFWERPHHMLGGSLTARLHLYSQESNSYQDVQRRAHDGNRKLDAAETNHRRTYYDAPDEDMLQAYIANLRRESPDIDLIEDMLSARDVRKNEIPTQNWPKLQLSPIDHSMLRLHEIVKERIGKFRFAH